MSGSASNEKSEVRQWSADELIPFECLVTDKKTGEPLPADGFVFTGSCMVTKPGERSQRVYAADFLQPQSIASIFNDPIAVLDVPRHARLPAPAATALLKLPQTASRARRGRAQLEAGPIHLATRGGRLVASRSSSSTGDSPEITMPRCTGLTKCSSTARSRNASSGSK